LLALSAELATPAAVPAVARPHAAAGMAARTAELTVQRRAHQRRQPESGARLAVLREDSAG
jgi:hypothetical protein